MARQTGHWYRSIRQRTWCGQQGVSLGLKFRSVARLVVVRPDRPCRARPADPDPARGGPERRRRPRPDGTGAIGTGWVHAEPAGRGVQRAPAVTHGQHHGGHDL